MKNKLTWIIIAAAALIVVLVGAFFGYKYLSKLYAPEGQEHPTSSATAATDFTVLDGAGQQVALSSKFGKPIVLNFWATWCGPCQSEMPAFDAMYQKYGDQVEFMMVNLTDGSRDTVESATEMIGQLGYTFPIYFDTTLTAASTYGAYSIPLSVFIDAEGKVVQTHTGAMDEATLENYIKTIL